MVLGEYSPPSQPIIARESTIHLCGTRTQIKKKKSKNNIIIVLICLPYFLSFFLRAVNNGILDTYQLKSLDALLGKLAMNC